VITRGAVPVPLKVTVCVLPATALLLSVTVSEPARAPVAAGVNVMATVQAVLAASGDEIEHVVPTA
jgi:hypothetical protein